MGHSSALWPLNWHVANNGRCFSNLNSPLRNSIFRCHLFTLFYILVIVKIKKSSLYFTMELWMLKRCGPWLNMPCALYKTRLQQTLVMDIFFLRIESCDANSCCCSQSQDFELVVQLSSQQKRWTGGPDIENGCGEDAAFLTVVPAQGSMRGSR